MLARLGGVLMFAGAVLALCPAAHAQYSGEYDSCMGRAHSNTVQTGMCAQAELNRQDARLNKAYQALMAQFGADQPKKIQLRDDERAWLKKRDYGCKIDGNTIDNGCLMQKTASRADALEHQLKF